MTAYFKIISLALALLISTATNANYNDYDPLEIHTRTLYPKEITSISGALNYLLEPINYKVSTELLPDANEIISLPITPMARQVRTMAIYDAIQALIGEDNIIVVDHENKLISFMKDLNKTGTVK